MKQQIKKHLSFFTFLLSALVLSGMCLNVEAQKKTDSKILIKIDKQGCMGNCPAYSAQIYDDGTVVYKSEAWFQVKGIKRFKIPIDIIKQLVDESQRINYFSLKDRYETTISDGPSTTTSISIDGKQKEVFNGAGPKELYELEDKIEVLAGLTKFFNLDVRVAYFFKALNNDSAAKGIIINYGTAEKVAKRRADIKKFIVFRHWNLKRISFVSRIRNSETKTEFQIIKTDGKKTNI
jgi:hypothetical protein